VEARKLFAGVFATLALVVLVFLLWSSLTQTDPEGWGWIVVFLLSIMFVVPLLVTAAALWTLHRWLLIITIVMAFLELMPLCYVVFGAFSALQRNMPLPWTSTVILSGAVAVIGSGAYSIVSLKKSKASS